VWSHTIIFCGHFPDGAEVFTEEQIEGETRGQWYLRQLLGSANIDGSPLFHIMSGNLSHQIEHHLFPDLPSNRYGQIAPQVRALCERFGLPYNTGPLSRQTASVWKRVFRLALPGPKPATNREPTTAEPMPAAA
jgi:NADPH-dependent stearoyl-CoA 9-desaturase